MLEIEFGTFLDVGNCPSEPLVNKNNLRHQLFATIGIAGKHQVHAALRAMTGVVLAIPGYLSALCFGFIYQLATDVGDLHDRVGEQASHRDGAAITWWYRVGECQHGTGRYVAAFGGGAAVRNDAVGRGKKYLTRDRVYRNFIYRVAQ